MKLFLISLIAVLAILGLCEVLHTVWMFLISPTVKPKTFSFALIDDEDDPVKQLHYAGNLFSWGNRADEDFKIALYNGALDETYDECLKTAKQYDIILITEKSSDK